MFKNPYASNKMIKVDINKYEDEKDDDDDDEDNDDHEHTEIDDNVVHHGHFQGLTTIMPPSPHQSHLPQSSSSSTSDLASASASTMRHSIATTPESHHYNGGRDSLMELAKSSGKHMTTLGTPYHHYYGFASSSSSGLNNDIMTTTTLLPYELLTPSVTATITTPITDEEVLPHVENIDTGKKVKFST